MRDARGSPGCHEKRGQPLGELLLYLQQNIVASLTTQLGLHVLAINALFDVTVGDAKARFVARRAQNTLSESESRTEEKCQCPAFVSGLLF